ncbi:MAG: hypothetical protein SVM86_00295, partial [Candidatus Cloacimonadota bacterium]|nr:hypothetical protein [Candidatus Cloacimonadota bacterium]
MLRRTVLFFLLLLFIFSGCSFPEEFGLPSWESTFRMSILNDNYDVTELAEEDSALVAIGDTLAFFKTDSESVEIELDSTEEVNEYKEVEIGEIEINAPQPKNTEITIQEMVEDYGLAVPGLNESMHGQPVIAPQFAVDEMIEKFDKFDEFQEVRFSSGYLDMKFTNNMIFWLGSADGELPFTAKLRGVYQDGSVEDLIELDFPEGIAPNGGIVEYNNYDISGMLIPDSLRVVISGWSDGTAGGHEILDYYAGLNIDMDFHDFIVEYAIAPIPAQAIDDTVEVKISEEYEIYRADVAEGNYILRLDIQNQIDLNIHANIYINKLFDTDGQPYETNFVIPRSEGGSTDYQKNINLSGFSIGDDSEPVEKVIIDFFTFTEDTEEEVRIIDSNDKLMIDAVLGPLDFAYIKAIIAEQQDIEPINGDFDIDLDVETQGLFEIVGESQMKLDLSYGNSKIPAQLILNLTAINENGESVDLIDLDTNTSPIIEIPSVSHYTIIKDFSDYNLNEILSIIPTDINYEVIPLIGGAGSEEAEVYVGDRLNADIEFTSKIELNTDSWLIPK